MGLFYVAILTTFLLLPCSVVAYCYEYRWFEFTKQQCVQSVDGSGDVESQKRRAAREISSCTMLLYIMYRICVVRRAVVTRVRTDWKQMHQLELPSVPIYGKDQLPNSE
jgi:hypothetical protein